jgi:hypothetical protein
MHHVVGCSNCDNLWIAYDEPKTTSCTLCGERYKFRKLKKLYSDPDEEKAKQALTLKQAEVNDVEHIEEKLRNSKMFDTDVKRAISDEEYLKRKGVSVDGDEDDGTDFSSLSDEELVMEAVSEVDEPTEENIISFTEQYGVSEKKTREMIDRLCLNGEAMRKRNGEIRLL